MKVSLSKRQEKDEKQREGKILLERDQTPDIGVGKDLCQMDTVLLMDPWECI